jgi:hypothetical protein
MSRFPIATSWNGEEYLSRLKGFVQEREHVVDKMPMNYLLVPFLYHTFPNAKIIHLKRDPTDTALSIFTTINSAKIQWLHAKETIALTYREYLRAMEAWRDLLPSNSFLEIQYEELVEEPERVSREMIAFTGQPWDPACLNPEVNGRAVMTPSVWQVRQPIYKSSMQRWKNFEPWLGPLRITP